jgi:diamine N-acetyltransferase
MPGLSMRAPEGVSYRVAQPADAEALDALFRGQFRDSYSHRYGESDMALFFAARGVDGWRRDLIDPACAVRVAVAGQAIVGYAKLGPMSLPHDVGGRRALELRQLYVRTSWHGRGLGAALAGWAIDEARRRGAEDLYLAVFPFQRQARSFYGRMGFEELTTFRFTLGTVEDDDMICRMDLGVAARGDRAAER